jgi:hypothetical protein
MTERDPHELAQALERETDDLAREGQEVKAAIQDTREDWERKRRDENVPGAPPPEGSESDEADEAGESGEADEAGESDEA